MSSTPSHGVSAWQRDLPVLVPQPALSHATDARVVVVGAGIAGLALAHRLARLVPPDEILVLEAARAGDGASGRSTGIVGPGVGGPATALVKRYGKDVAARMFGASLEGVAAMRRLVGQLPDDCELTDTYQLVAANAPAHAGRLRRQAETLRELGFDTPFLDREQTAARLGTDRYHGSLCYPDISTVNPWRLCQVLKSELLAAGVRIAEGTAVSAVAGGDPVTLTAGGHRVRAGTVAIATDGFTGSVGLYKRNIAAVRTHVVRTAVLPEDLLAETGWNGDGAVIDSRSFFNYFRLTPRRAQPEPVFGGGEHVPGSSARAQPEPVFGGGEHVPGSSARAQPGFGGGEHAPSYSGRRLVFGGGPAVPEQRTRQARVDAIRDRIIRELAAVFPALAEVPVTDFWSGVTGSTFDRIPIVGPVPQQPGVWYAGAWCGHGLSMSALTAEMLAPRLAGAADWPAADRALPWLRPTAGWLPNGPLGDLALAGYLSGLDTADKLTGGGRRKGTGRGAPARSLPAALVDRTGS